MTNTVIMIDGGAGRVISALPAIERYIELNPEKNVKVFVYGWDFVVFGNKKLQNITYNIEQKHVFKDIFMNADEVIHPEPYVLPEYFKQEYHLSQAFDYLINGSTGKTPLIPKLCCTKKEKIAAKSIIDDIKKHNENKKIIVLQPFGSNATFNNSTENAEIIDTTSRSMSLEMYSNMAKALSEKYSIILFAPEQFHFKEDVFTHKFPQASLRDYIALIDQADYFIGVDSVGQHISRGLNKPGMVILGSTFAKNITYDDWFIVVDKYKNDKTYLPMRINHIDYELAESSNSFCMDYCREDVLEMCNLVGEFL